MSFRSVPFSVSSPDGGCVQILGDKPVPSWVPVVVRSMVDELVQMDKRVRERPRSVSSLSSARHQAAAAVARQDPGRAPAATNSAAAGAAPVDHGSGVGFSAVTAQDTVVSGQPLPATQYPPMSAAQQQPPAVTQPVLPARAGYAAEAAQYVIPQENALRPRPQQQYYPPQQPHSYVPSVPAGEYQHGPPDATAFVPTRDPRLASAQPRADYPSGEYAQLRQQTVYAPASQQPVPQRQPQPQPQPPYPQYAGPVPSGAPYQYGSMADVSQHELKSMLRSMRGGDTSRGGMASAHTLTDVPHREDGFWAGSPPRADRSPPGPAPSSSRRYGM